ncbi:hypothetical protein CEXT_501331 [Caerostris extrusa]|uniref:Uncharacterized protein n=1 Tax=Caerostris extrusa TaxID=172846 RepID=A0AAV4VIG2_CAEEX|nr:hypothetical protein CEXT_501331 [Caerostris extrusa]
MTSVLLHTLIDENIVDFSSAFEPRVVYKRKKTTFKCRGASSRKNEKSSIGGNTSSSLIDTTTITRHIRRASTFNQMRPKPLSQVLHYT